MCLREIPIKTDHQNKLKGFVLIFIPSENVFLKFLYLDQNCVQLSYERQEKFDFLGDFFCEQF